MSSVLSSANASNPAVKRIMREYAEFDQSYSAARSSNSPIDVVAAPLSDNLFEWHFTLRGPPGSVYAGGVYHGRVLLPSNYPFRPPDIVLLTPSGRFETGKKICLSISSYHPNNWQPSWSIRTALTALSAFFTTPAAGAIGSLDYPDREKQQLAARSGQYCCPHCQQTNQHIMHKHTQAAAHTTTDSDDGRSDNPQAQQEVVARAAHTTSEALPSRTHLRSHCVLLTWGSAETVSARSPRPNPAVQATVDSSAAPSAVDTNTATLTRPAASSQRAALPTTPVNAAPHAPDASTALSSSPRTHSQSAQPASSDHSAHSSAIPSSSSSLPHAPQPAVNSQLTANDSVNAHPLVLAPATATSIASRIATIANTANTATASAAASTSAAAAPATAFTPATAPATATPASSSRVRVLTVSLAVLVAAVLFRKLVAHLLSAHPSHASIVLHSL